MPNNHKTDEPADEEKQMPSGERYAKMDELLEDIERAFDGRPDAERAEPIIEAVRQLYSRIDDLERRLEEIEKALDRPINEGTL